MLLSFRLRSAPYSTFVYRLWRSVQSAVLESRCCLGSCVVSWVLVEVCCRHWIAPCQTVCRSLHEVRGTCSCSCVVLRIGHFAFTYCPFSRRLCMLHSQLQVALAICMWTLTFAFAFACACCISRSRLRVVLAFRICALHLHFAFASSCCILHLHLAFAFACCIRVGELHLHFAFAFHACISRLRVWPRVIRFACHSLSRVPVRAYCTGSTLVARLSRSAPAFDVPLLFIMRVVVIDSQLPPQYLLRYSTNCITH